MPKRIIFSLVLIASLTAGLLRLYAYDYSEFPRIDSVSPPNFSIVYGGRVDIFGSASSRFEISSVEIDKQKALLKSGVFELPGLPLLLGKNIFLIKATDIFGNRKNFLYTIYRENPPIEPVLRVETKSEIPDEEAPAGTPIDTPKAEGVTAPRQSAKTANPSAKEGAPSGTRPITVYTNTTYTADTINNSGQTYQAAASPVNPSVNSQDNNPPAQQSAGKPIVTFSSPYSDQVIMEDTLQIGGSFDPSANITDITVNGQKCPLKPGNTFEGPILLSPGEARRRHETSDSDKYIIMKVDPVTHSGKNTLKVVIINDRGRASKEKITYYYYQMFVNMRADARYSMKDDSDGQVYAAPEFIMMFNPDLYYQPPEDPYFHDWEYPDKNYREFWYDSYSAGGWGATLFYSGHYEYYSMKPFYMNYANRFGWFWFFMNPSELNAYKRGEEGGHYSSANAHEFLDTVETLHAPPLKGLPFIVLFKNCAFLENNPFFWQPPYPTPAWQGLQLNLDEYTVEGQPLKPLYGNFGKPLSPEDVLKGNCTYVAIEDFVPDTDFQLKVDMPPYRGEFWGGGRMWTRFFGATLEYGMTGDILVDSNNDGFLGGDDNAVEQVAPGCVFWVNSDDDSSESTIHPDDADAAYDEFDKDYEDDAINGIRDLEDFMPIDLTIPNIKEWSSPDKNVKFYLKAEGDGKIGIFERVDETDNTYLTELEYAKQQYKKETKFILPSSKKEGQLLDPSWFNSEGKFYGIFEGVEKGELKLKLEVELGIGKNKDRVVLDEAYITLKDVQDMYLFCNVRYNTLGYGIVAGSDKLLVDNKFQGTEKDNNGIYRYLYNYETGYIYPDNPKEIFFWTHGYYNDAKQAKMVTDTIVKRMYRSGYRGAFIGITWHAHEGWTQLAFNADWINSFQSGRIVADILTTYRKKYPNAKINLSAHSLGNNAISYAIRLIAVENAKKSVENKITLDNLILAEAAVPGETFSGYDPKRRGYYFDNMYGIDATVVKKVYNTYSEKDKVLYDAWSANNCLSGLETPLDNEYNLINRNPWGFIFPQEALRAPLGLKAAESSLSNFENKTRYKSETKHPYGIRRHGSMMDEYYYDVASFYELLIDPESPDEKEEE